MDSQNFGSIQYSPLGHTSSDPLQHYQHICDSCKIVKYKREQTKTPDVSASFISPEPQAYDPNNHITHYLNVCFKAPDALRCHLVPNSQLANTGNNKPVNSGNNQN